MCEFQGDDELDREDAFRVESFTGASFGIPFDVLGPSRSVDEAGSLSLSLGWADIVDGVDVLPPGPDEAPRGGLARVVAGEATLAPVSAKRSLTELNNFSVRSRVASSHFLPSKSCS